MPALEYQKYETFARECARLEMAGDPTDKTRLRRARDEAYRRAGFTAGTNSARHNARRLANRPEVRARIAELIRDALEHANITPEKVAVRVDRIGRANVADYYEADGRTLKNIKELPIQLQEAIQSIEWTPERHPDGTLVEWRATIKLYDKLTANLAILRQIGVIADEPTGSTGQISILNVLSVDDQRLLAEALAALPGGKGEADSGTKPVDRPADTLPETV